MAAAPKGPRCKMKYTTLLFLSLLALISQGCTNDPPKEYPPAPMTPLYSAKLSWAKLHSPIGVDKYSWLVPAVNKTAVYVAERNGTVSKLDINTGKTLWRKKTDFRFSAGPVLGDNTLYAGTSKAIVVAMSAETGKIKWQQDVSSEILVPPLIKNDHLFVRTNDGKVFGLRARDGKIFWSYDRNVPALTLRGNSPLLAFEDNVIVGFANGRLISLSMLDGKTNWETAISLPKGRTELERIVDIDGELSEKNGILYVSSFNGKTAAVDARSGSIIWTRDLPSNLGAMIDDKNVYLTDARGQIWALDKNSGSTLWKQDKLEGRANTRPLIFDNKLVVGDVMGELYWLSLSDGRILGHLPYDRASKLSGATSYVDEIEDDSYFVPRRPDTAVIFEPRVSNNHLIVTYQNGITASVQMAH